MVYSISDLRKNRGGYEVLFKRHGFNEDYEQTSEAFGAIKKEFYSVLECLLHTADKTIQASDALLIVSNAEICPLQFGESTVIYRP